MSSSPQSTCSRVHFWSLWRSSSQEDKHTYFCLLPNLTKSSTSRIEFTKSLSVLLSENRDQSEAPYISSILPAEDAHLSSSPQALNSHYGSLFTVNVVVVETGPGGDLPSAHVNLRKPNIRVNTPGNRSGTQSDAPFRGGHMLEWGCFNSHYGDPPLIHRNIHQADVGLC